MRTVIYSLCGLAFGLSTMAAPFAAATESVTEPEAGAPAGILPAEWQQLVQGRTVTYMINGKTWAQEAYDKATNTVAIRLIDGTCMEGTWTYENGEYCFAWSGGEYSCFLHVRSGDDILIIPVIDGAQTGTMQTVGAVSDLPLSCGPALTS